MKQFALFALVGILLFSCSNEETKKTSNVPTKEYLKGEINKMNDSLQIMYKKMMEEPGYKFPYLAINEAVYYHLQYYKFYPKDNYSAECLDKVQQLYLQKKAYELSLKYTDTLLLKYPNYKGRPNLLLNAGSTGEILQDTSIIRKYYTQLLTENPKLNPETKQMVTFRLKHLDLTFDQLIDLQIKKISNK